MSSPPVKRPKTCHDNPFHLIYWPGFPGRGEHVRLALEEAGATYTDTAHTDSGMDEVLAISGGRFATDGPDPPPFAPPVLRHGDVVLSQTSNILLYLGRQLGLAPAAGDDDDDDDDAAAATYRVNALALTALDGLSDEPHECHHPVGADLCYEDQVAESKRRARGYVTTRLPRFLAYFERVLEQAAARRTGDAPWLCGDRLTYADLVLFQCLDGLKFMFRRAMAKRQAEGEYPRVFALHDAVRARPNIQAYLASDRRQSYGDGIYRYYEELDFEG